MQNAQLLDSLFADDGTRPLLGRRLSPTLAEVAPQQLAAIQALLWQRDYLPALTAAPELDNLLENTRSVVSEPQWQLQPDGLLQPLYAVTNLYLAAASERVSEPDEASGWRKITASTIQRALTTGLSLEAIIHFLQHYCQGGIPGSLLIRLKLWGQGYREQSTIQVERLPMLYLSAHVLQDIQADEDLRDLLGAEVAQGGRLVRVERENLERVVELLKERGFAVE